MTRQNSKNPKWTKVKNPNSHVKTGIRKSTKQNLIEIIKITGRSEAEELDRMVSEKLSTLPPPQNPSV